MRSTPGIATLATALAVALVHPSVAAQDPAPRVMAHYGPQTGTIVRIDQRTRTFELLTGVGHALRLTRVHLPPELGVRTRAAEARMSALTPGCIVRVQCKTAGPRTEATSVELLQTPEPSR